MKGLVAIALLCAAIPVLFPYTSSAARPRPVTLAGNVIFLSPLRGWVEISTSAGYSASCYRAMPQPAFCNRATTDIYATDDGGRTWRRALRFSSQPYIGENALPTTWMHAFDTEHILILPVGLHAPAILYRTTDGGAHWTSLPHPQPLYAESLSTTDVTFANPNDLWLLAHEGAAMGSEAIGVYRTRDGGRRWSMVACTLTPATPPNQQCRRSSGIGFPGFKDSIVFANPSTGILTDNNYAYTPFLYVTHDGGARWRVERPPTSGRAGSAAVVHFTEYQRPLFFGRFAILPARGSTCRGRPTLCQDRFYTLLSHDGGKIWPVTRQFPPAFPSGPTTLPVWQALTASTWYLMGATHLWVTTDAGARWRAIPLRIPHGYAPVTVQFVTGSTGWVLLARIDRSNNVATSTQLLETKDGGLHWTSVPLPGSAS